MRSELTNFSKGSRSRFCGKSWCGLGACVVENSRQFGVGGSNHSPPNWSIEGPLPIHRLDAPPTLQQISWGVRLLYSLRSRSLLPLPPFYSTTHTAIMIIYKVSAHSVAFCNGLTDWQNRTLSLATSSSPTPTTSRRSTVSPTRPTAGRSPSETITSVCICDMRRKHNFC